MGAPAPKRGPGWISIATIWPDHLFAFSIRTLEGKPEMELRNYFRIIRRRIWIVLSTTLVTLAFVGVGSYLAVPSYTATTLVRVTQIQDDVISFSDINYVERLMNTYTLLITSTPFMERIIDDANLDTTPGQLAASIQAEVIPETELISISVNNSDPSLAMEIANRLGQLLLEERDDFYSGPGKSTLEIIQEQIDTMEENISQDRALLESMLSGRSSNITSTSIQELNSRIRAEEQALQTLHNDYERARWAELARENSVSIVQAADLPQSPSSPKTTRNMVFGAIAGSLAGIGLAFLVENLDTGIPSIEKLNALTEHPLVGWVPKLRRPRRFGNYPFLVENESYSPDLEAFRMLRSNILDGSTGDPPPIQLYTSAEPSSGKTTLVSNLAMAFAKSGRNVIAIDADMRNPGLHRVFGLQSHPGFVDLLRDPSDIHSALQRTNNPLLRIVASGKSPEDPGDFLARQDLEKVFSELAKESEIILIDSPPLLVANDARLVARYSDRVFIVAAQGQTMEAELLSAINMLGHPEIGSIGLIFNRIDGRDAYSYAYSRAV